MNCNKKDEWAPTIPYSSIFIDAGWSDFTFAAKECVKSCGIQEINSRKSEISNLFVTKQNSNKSLICLSVRTAFDLFFRVKKFPSGSEVIMTAVNIPSMAEIVLHHGLKIVPWDFDVRTFTPDAGKLNDLINDKTVAVVFAHLFGKWCRNLRPFLNVTRSRNVCFIEDCAETFLGFDYLGDPSSDLAMFSFGIIKYYTCFGGALVKIRDENLLTLMSNEYDADPIVSNREYLEKIFKYRLVATGLNVPLVARFCVPFFRMIGVDHKKGAINLLRGFPRDELIKKIRRQPSSALLAVMLRRLSSVDNGQFWLTKEKGNFVEQILAESGIAVPGCDIDSKNYWLFPIIVNNPNDFVSKINRLGVDAFTKASQLSIVVDADDDKTTTTPMADDMLKHLVYLPVHKNVPYIYLIKICDAVRQCLQCDNNNNFIKSKL